MAFSGSVFVCIAYSIIIENRTRSTQKYTKKEQNIPKTPETKHRKVKNTHMCVCTRPSAAEFGRRRRKNLRPPKIRRRKSAGHNPAVKKIIRPPPDFFPGGWILR